MDVDENSAIKHTSSGKDYYFCSKGCLDTFKHGGRWYKNRVFIVSSILALLCMLSLIFPILEPFRVSLIAYIKRIWWAVSLGLVLGGVIDYFVPKEYISEVLSRPKKRTILYSVLLGFLMSVCSHGILALSIQLHKKGASNPAVISFLLASPWANIAVTLMLFSFFGVKALYIVLSAILVALITGFTFQFLQSKNLIETNSNTKMAEANFSIVKDIKKRVSSYRLSVKQIQKDASGIISGAISLSNMVLWWILIGVGLASIVGAYVPESIFQNYMGPSFLGLLVTLVVATILEVCSEGTAPLAFEIYRQTGALGNPFVFLMAGVVTDYTEIGLLWHNVGKRVAIWLPIVAVPQVIILGIIANIIF